jgi:murein peptide amidase A
MQSNLSLHKRPPRVRSKTPLRRHYSRPISEVTALQHSPVGLVGSQATKLLRRLDQLSQTGAHLHNTPIPTPEHDKLPQIPRYVFVGDQPGESEIRLGIFAGLRPDDKAGPQAVADFIEDLVNFPSLGNAYRIYAYPMANPIGFETPRPSKRHQGRGHHPEVGPKVKSPEVHLIEREQFVVQFQGLIVIHTADEIEGLEAAVYGANLQDALVSPILSTLRPLLPTTEPSVPDPSWSITADADLKQRPFELTLRLPSSGWQTLYSIGLRIALHTAVDRYRSFLAQANNI